MTTTSMAVALADIEPDETINARRTRTNEGIEELKASIRAHGLIQALRVRQHDAISGKFKIIAGHRRHRVLCELATDGDSAAGVTVTHEFPVPVIIGDADDDAARELSQAENLIRLPQHEADTYETFRDLADRGLDESQIAARFGIEPKRVKRMLALGRLSPLILDWWRSEEQTNETTATVRAFTLAPSLDDQEKLFKKLSKQGDVRAWAVKRALGADNHQAAKAIKIAGLDAYKAAGGRFTQDLFGDNPVISDPDIATRVAEEKIKAVIDGLKAEEWSWVSLADDLPYGWSYGWSKEKPSAGKMTADEKKQIKKLEKTIAKAGDAGCAGELASLQKAIADRQWTPEQIAKAGAVLQIGHHGDLTITRGVVKPPAPKKEKAATGERQVSSPTISNAIHHRLSKQATYAAAAALKEEPRLGLVALLAGFLSGSAYGQPVRVYANGIGVRDARQIETFDRTFGRLAGMTDDELFKIAAGVAAGALDMQRQHNSQAAFDKASNALVGAINADRMTAALREKFDIQDYFDSVAKSFVITAIREAINEDEARKADKLKKKDLVEFAVKNVAGTGWLPPELRAPTYSGPGAIPVLAAAPPTHPDDDDLVDDEFADDDEAA